MNYLLGLFEQHQPISFPRDEGVNGAQSNRALMITMLTNNLTNKNEIGIISYCVKHLKAIAIIVDTHAEKKEAQQKLLNAHHHLGITNDAIDNLLALFTNHGGYFTQVLVNESAAKYTQALLKIFNALSNRSLSEVGISEQELVSINLVKENRCMSYVKNLTVHYNQNNDTLNIQLSSNDWLPPIHVNAIQQVLINNAQVLLQHAEQQVQQQVQQQILQNAP